eukprot:1160898-Pelagomonas_calceolata.AAC.1
MAVEDVKEIDALVITCRNRQAVTSGTVQGNGIVCVRPGPPASLLEDQRTCMMMMVMVMMMRHT